MVSVNGLRQMMIDVNYLEYFAGDAIPEFSVATETFGSIHQLLDLTIKSDWPQYLSSYGKTSNQTNCWPIRSFRKLRIAVSSYPAQSSSASIREDDPLPGDCAVFFQVVFEFETLF